MTAGTAAISRFAESEVDVGLGVDAGLGVDVEVDAVVAGDEASKLLSMVFSPCYS